MKVMGVLLNGLCEGELLDQALPSVASLEPWSSPWGGGAWGTPAVTLLDKGKLPPGAGVIENEWG